MRKKVCGLMAPGIVICLSAAGAHALAPGPKCESSKLGTSAKYAQCRLKADAKAVKSGDPVDYSKCTLAKFGDAETQAGMGGCPSEGDQTAIGAFVDACTDSVAGALGGGPLPLDVLTCNDGLDDCLTTLGSCPSDLTATNADLVSCTADLGDCQANTCGNDETEFGELCDGLDLHGKSCATETPSTPYGTLTCNVDCDGFDSSGCLARFDASGASIIDYATGLEWEKKEGADGASNSSNPHDVDNDYSWCVGPYITGPCNTANNAFNGTAATDFLAALNGGSSGSCYAGHCDWRLPTPEEFQTITDPVYPCSHASCYIDTVFLPGYGSFPNGHYLTSRTEADPFRESLWVFPPGAEGSAPKTNSYRVRAVRSGT